MALNLYTHGLIIYAERNPYALAQVHPHPMQTSEEALELARRFAASAMACEALPLDLLEGLAAMVDDTGLYRLDLLARAAAHATGNGIKGEGA